MKKTYSPVFILVALTIINWGCKKENSVTPPIWDLSGKIIFNLHGGNLSGINVIDLNSSELTLSSIVTIGDEPRVNSNGDKIVYTGSQTGMIDIFTVNITGGTPIDLTPNSPSLTDSWPDWSPDGLSIAFNRVFYPGFKEAVCVMNKDGSNLHNLTDTSSLAVAVMPRWSSDRSNITFIGQTSFKPPVDYNLYLINPDGSNQVLLDRIGSILPSSLPSWSPDSRTIAYCKSNQTMDDTTGGLYVIDIVSRVSQKINVNGKRTSPAGYSWLPDGKLICVGINPVDTSYEVFVVSNFSSSEGKLIARGLNYNAVTTPSPDGKHIAIFGTAKNGGTFALYVVNADGNNFRKLKDIDNPKAFIVNYQYCQWLK
ncbi:MAG: hypothetical protein PHP42_01035 [Bacteroidota bacterium]|nr:hypothetical protein [Bacteroidota bacterium]